MSADPPKKKDVLLALSANERGDGVHVIRQRDESLEVGELRAAKEGKPITGELVRLTPREDHQRLFDVEVLATSAGAESASARTGPAQVATTAYRSNWERIFTPPRDDELN